MIRAANVCQIQDATMNKSQGVRGRSGSYAPYAELLKQKGDLSGGKENLNAAVETFDSRDLQRMLGRRGAEKF